MMDTVLSVVLLTVMGNVPLTNLNQLSILKRNNSMPKGTEKKKGFVPFSKTKKDEMLAKPNPKEKGKPETKKK